MSLKKHFAWLVLVFCAASFVSADTIQLKDKAAVTGKILAEKPDAVVVDVGYTVLVVPRSSIANMIKTETVVTQTSVVTSPTTNVNATPQFYYSTLLVSPARDVSSLVKQIGEAVVQVRTPGGLGSGVHTVE